MTRLLASSLYGVEPRDAATLIATPLVLGLLAVLACLVPAIPATRIDPVRALRAE